MSVRIDEDHGRAQVGLGEDERRRQGHVEQREERHAAPADGRQAVGQKGGQGDRDDDERELRGLEVHERQRDPAPRPAGHRAQGEHRRDGEHDEPVERPLPAPVVLVVDERQHEERGHADRGEDELVAGVVERGRQRVVPRGEVDHGHAEDEQPAGRRQQQVVEMTQVGAQVHGRRSLR